jgi:hypothetical protein
MFLGATVYANLVGRVSEQGSQSVHSFSVCKSRGAEIGCLCVCVAFFLLHGEGIQAQSSLCEGVNLGSAYAQLLF